MSARLLRPKVSSGRRARSAREPARGGSRRSQGLGAESSQMMTQRSLCGPGCIQTWITSSQRSLNAACSRDESIRLSDCTTTSRSSPPRISTAKPPGAAPPLAGFVMQRIALLFNRPENAVSPTNPPQVLPTCLTHTVLAKVAIILNRSDLVLE